MPFGEQCSAYAAVVRECGAIHAFHGNGSLHIAELPDIIIAIVRRSPTQKGVADGLQRLLVFHDPLPLMHVPGSFTMHKGSDARSSGLLQLKEDHVVRAVA